VTFYRQSDIPEIPELTWFLTCVTGKGILNRAHAYKAAVDKNAAAGADVDSDVTAGLFMYPVLMGADILMFNAHKVPVGRDQVQHWRWRATWPTASTTATVTHFTLPEVVIEDAVATLPGTDGRKMSKSYDNHIPLFAPRASSRNSSPASSPTPACTGRSQGREGSALFQIYQAFASETETAALRQAYADGIAWGDAKQSVFERLDREITPMRERYDALIRDPAAIEAILLRWRTKARNISTPFMAGCAMPSGCATCSPKRRRRRSRLKSPPRQCSSSTARPMASSISSWSTPLAPCCCRARLSTRRGNRGS
jgi:tryptophanyl-tRNA synthetase